jgi:hypothetical protein
MKTSTKICAATVIALGLAFVGSAEAKKGDHGGGKGHGKGHSKQQVVYSSGPIGHEVRRVARRASISSPREVIVQERRRVAAHHDSSDWGDHHHRTWHGYRPYGYFGSSFLFGPSYSYWPYRTYYSSPAYYDYGYAAPYSYYHHPAYHDYVSSLEADVQSELAQRGYYHGAIDGIIGPQSRDALRAFQYDAGLPETGRIDAATLVELGLG